MNYLDYHTAFKTLDQFIDQYNDRVVISSKRLKSGAVFTAREIIRLYGLYLLKEKSSSNMPSHCFPSFKTNNGQLARPLKCSRRTIQRHITRLSEAGFITCKTFHGSHANYELSLNEEFLSKVILVKKPVHKSQNNLIAQTKSTPESAYSCPVKKPYTTNRPLSYSTRNNNNIIIGCEFVENEVFNNSQPNQKDEIKFELGGLPVNRTEDPRETVSNPPIKPYPVTGHNIAPGANFPARLLWMMARSLLYKHTLLTDRQEQTAKTLTLKLYESVPEERLWAVHQAYVERIALVHKYVKRNPQNRFVPLPYIFFDTNNSKGFVGTKKWHQESRKRQKEVSRELTLQAAIRSYIQNDELPPCKRQSQIKLFLNTTKHLNKIEPGQVSAFHEAVLEYEIRRKNPFFNQLCNKRNYGRTAT